MSERKVLAQIAELQRLDRAELKERWRSLFDTEPPGYSKEMMFSRLAYRVQELAYGGAEGRLAGLVHAGDDMEIGPSLVRCRKDQDLVGKVAETGELKAVEAHCQACASRSIRLSADTPGEPNWDGATLSICS